MFDDAKRQN